MGDQPALSGNWPDGTGAVSVNHPGAGFIATPEAIPVGRLLAGAGRLRAPPIFQASSEAAPADVPKIEVREFRFTGNTVFSNAELARVVASYLNRKLNSDDLEDARRRLTRHYTDAGFINSGAVLDDQPVQNGIVTFRIVEGRLSEIEISGNKWLRTSFLEARIRHGAGEPLNLNTLQETLLALKNNPNLRSLNARLMPAPTRGEGRLELDLKERNPWHLGLAARNDRPPSVGAEIIEVLASHQNVTGHSDAFELQYGLLERSKNSAKFSGAENWGASYRAPLNVYDTTLQLGYHRSDYTVLEEPFDALDIESRSDSISVGLRQPLFRSAKRELSMTLAVDRRHSEGFLLGEPFSFSPGAVDGEATVTALRFIHEWVDRSLARVIALRSIFSWGIDALDSTDDGTVRDGKFATWVGQAQYVHRLGETANELVLRGAFQWSNDPLLSLEQLSVGGASTVRGYRENQLVRDVGAVASLEFRVPILSKRAGGPLLQLAPFLDYGHGWNLEGPKGTPRDIASAGLGLVFTPYDKIHAELYWGYAFRDLRPAKDLDLQDRGLHFKVVAWAF